MSETITMSAEALQNLINQAVTQALAQQKDKPGTGHMFPKKPDAKEQAPDYDGPFVCPCCAKKLRLAAWEAKDNGLNLRGSEYKAKEKATETTEL